MKKTSVKFSELKVGDTFRVCCSKKMKRKLKRSVFIKTADTYYYYDFDKVVYNSVELYTGNTRAWKDDTIVIPLEKEIKYEVEPVHVRHKDMKVGQIYYGHGYDLVDAEFIKIKEEGWIARNVWKRHDTSNSVRLSDGEKFDHNPYFEFFPVKEIQFIKEEKKTLSQLLVDLWKRMRNKYDF